MDLFREVQKISEAYCVKHAIPVTRKFTDAELSETLADLEQVETDEEHFERTQATNHEMTLDQQLDDPRRGQADAINRSGR